MVTCARSGVSAVTGTADADSAMPEILPREPLLWSSPALAVLGVTNTPVLTNHVRTGPPVPPHSPFGHAFVVILAPVSLELTSSLASASPRRPFCNVSVFVLAPVPSVIPSSIAFYTAETVALRSLFYMYAIRATCVRNKLGPPNSVETLSESAMGLIDNAGQVGGIEAAVDYLTAALALKSATAVRLNPKLASQAATLDGRAEAVRAEAQRNQVGLEAKVTSLEVCLATARADMAIHDS